MKKSELRKLIKHVIKEQARPKSRGKKINHAQILRSMLPSGINPNSDISSNALRSAQQTPAPRDISPGPNPNDPWYPWSEGYSAYDTSEHCQPPMTDDTAQALYLFNDFSPR